MVRPLDVLYEDDRFVAVMKPAGVPVHGGARVQVTPVVKRLDATPVHRLDAATSGVLLLAKSPEALRQAAADWPNATKRYLAVVMGAMDDQVVERPLEDGGRTRPARTGFRQRATSPGWSLIEATLDTGRTHQIRRHAADVGHPVVMDDRYGDFAANKRFRALVRASGATNPKHQLLHAAQLSVLDLNLRAPLPERWRGWLAAAGLSGDGAASD